MKCLCVVLTLLFGLPGAMAQPMISGTIADKESKAPLELVAVGIVGKGIGTSTNPEGKFEILIDSSYRGDTLQVSIIGYEAMRIAVRNMTAVGNEIFLEPKSYTLEEVAVQSDKLVADEIIRGVLKGQQTNFNHDPFRLEAYYRELRMVNGKYDHLIEVALNTYGKGIEKYHKEIELVSTRKIDHFRFHHEENLLNSTLRLDYIANSEGIKLSDFKTNDFNLEDILVEDGVGIYLISSGHFPNRKYILFIREDNHAVVRLEMEDWYAERKQLYLAPIDKTNLFRLRYFKVINYYKAFEGKYYPDYISVLWDYDKYNSQTNMVTEKGELLREFKVNKISIHDIPKPHPSRIMDKYGLRLDDQMTPYDAEFWGQYNTIPLTSKVVSDLEANGPIEEQFIKNGARRP